MVYAKVKDNKIDKIGNLKELLHNVSNPIGLKLTELNEMEVYKVESENKQPKDWEIVQSVDYIFENNTVKEVKTFLVIDLEEYKKNKLIALKKECNQDILNSYPYEKQLNAIRGVYGDDYLQEMNTYIDTRRNIIKQLENYGTDYEKVFEMYYKKYIYDDNDDMKLINTLYWSDLK